MTRKFAALLALVFIFSIGQSAFGQNTNTSTMKKSGTSADRRKERGEERSEGRKHRRHRRQLRHSANANGNAAR